MKILCQNVSALSQTEFRALRKGKIGGSDIGAIAGLLSYRSPLQVWMQFTEKLPPVEENRAMRLGRAKEQLVASEFEIETGLKTKPVGEIWQHETIEWAIATPDFWVEYGKLLETKTCAARNFKYFESSAPESATVQLIWQMGIGNITEGYIACLSGDNDFVQYPVNYNANMFDGLLSIADQFMQCVRSDTPPELVGGDYSLVKELVPKIIPDKKIDVSHIKGLIDDYKVAQEKAKDADNYLDGLKGQLRFAMRDAQIGTIGDDLKVKITEVAGSTFTTTRKPTTQMRVY